MWVDCGYIGIQNYIQQNNLDKGSADEIEKKQKDFFDLLKQGKIKNKEGKELSGDLAQKEFQSYYPGYIKDKNPPFDILRARFLTKFLSKEKEVPKNNYPSYRADLLKLYTTCIIALDPEIGKNLSCVYDKNNLEKLKNECEEKLKEELKPNPSTKITNANDVNQKIIDDLNKPNLNKPNLNKPNVR